jgi:protein subunit release factor B
LPETDSQFGEQKDRLFSFVRPEFRVFRVFRGYLRLHGYDLEKASVMALPTQIDDRLAALGVRAGDVEERFVRGAGPGGQKINKTSSTVWLRHRPTGVEVRCQRERSQSANRELAWMELCAKLESRVRAAAAADEQAREADRRRHRQKSHGQKVKMIVAKKHRAKHKARRGRVGWDE